MKIKVLIVILFCAMILALGACDKNEGAQQEEPLNSAALITLSDFAVTPTPVDKYSLSTRVNLNSQFYNDLPLIDISTDATTDALLDCPAIQAILNTPFESDGNGAYRLSIPDASLADCIDLSSYEQFDMTIDIQANVSYLFEDIRLQDKNGNPVSLEGKTVPETLSDRVMSYKFRSNFSSSTSISANIMGIDYTSDSVSTGKWMTSDAETSCVLDDQYRFESCQEQFTSYLDMEETIDGVKQPRETYSDLEILSYNTGLETSLDGIYFTNGQIDFEIQNWSGTMTYDGTPDTAPTYSATDGTTTVCGTYGLFNQGSCATPKRLNLAPIPSSVTVKQSFKSLFINALLNGPLNPKHLNKLHERLKQSAGL
ncbi:MAG: hypothetical protein OEY59_01050 [Deltaproteobacteria bacterium]|nr:hypothetical protein [Deltaproteobacteria bacterium]